MYEYELVAACHKLLHDMFRLQPGETLAITLDASSSQAVADAMAQAAVVLEAKPLVLKNATPRGSGMAADPDLPLKSIIGAVRAADAWVELNEQWLLYSTAYNEIMADPDNRPRYMCLVGATPDLMVRNVGRVNTDDLRAFLYRVGEITKNAHHFRLTSPAGTDLEFDVDPRHKICVMDGLLKKGDDAMLPGQIAWTCNFDSLNGTLVFDGSVNPPLGKLDEPIVVTLEKSWITKIEGGKQADAWRAWLESFQDRAMFYCVHLAYGFGPGAQLTGSVVEDERVWGSTEWGFGFLSCNPCEELPQGLPAPSHTDGVTLNNSIWIDGKQFLDCGRVVGPDPETVALARKLGK